MAIALRYAARSDVGLVRRNNQDSGYAGPHLLVVADGMGGHAGGDVASSLAIGELAPLDGESHGRDALDHLSEAVRRAHAVLRDRVTEEPQLAGMGTTVTALLRTGNRLALAHVGDSRAYLLRDGVLTQVTKDHTFVQTLIDEGRLTPQEAEHHPQRSVIMRVLSDVIDDVELDLSVREARVGDRYLLCSDGLSGVVSPETLQETLAAGADPGPTCDTLVQLALRGGAPDNVTCVVADVVDVPTLADVAPLVVGAAASVQPPRRSGENGSAAERAAALTADGGPSAGDDHGDDGAAPSRHARLRTILGGLAVLAVLVAGGLAAWQWVHRQYYVGAHDGAVAIYRGLPQDVGPVSLADVDEVADVALADLPPYQQDRLRSGIVVETEARARSVVATLRDQALLCRTTGPTTGPTTEPTATPSPGISGASPAPSAGATQGGTDAGTLGAAAGAGGLGSASPSVTPVASGSPSTAPSPTVSPSGTVSPSPGSSPTPGASPVPDACGATAP